MNLPCFFDGCTKIVPVLNGLPLLILGSLLCGFVISVIIRVARGGKD